MFLCGLLDIMTKYLKKYVYAGGPLTKKGYGGGVCSCYDLSYVKAEWSTSARAARRVVL